MTIKQRILRQKSYFIIKAYYKIQQILHSISKQNKKIYQTAKSNMPNLYYIIIDTFLL